jgi:EpsI family protein
MMRDIARSRFPIALAGVALALCYAGVVATLVGEWSTDYLYSYGFAVPLISWYVVWAKSQELGPLRPSPDYLLGIPVSVAGAAMLVAGHLGALMTVQETSLVVTLAGVVLLLFGRDIMRVLWFPIAYLLLMVPIWSYPIGLIQDPSQVVTGRIAVGLLHVVGVPAIQEGVRVVLPRLTLDVMRECSGVNQLIAVVALTLPAAYLWLESSTRRIALLGLAVVVVYLTNGFRVALVGFLGYKGFSGGSNPILHLLEGLVLSGIGYTAIYGCFTLLSKGQRSDRRHTEQPVSAPPAERPGRPPVPRPWLQAGALVVVLSAGGFPLLFRPADVRLSHELRMLPGRIDDWTMETIAEPSVAQFAVVDDDLVGAHPGNDAERRFVGVDDELVRAYRNAAGQQIRLYVGYYRYQEDGKKLAGSASAALHAASSRVTVHLGAETIALNQVVQPLRATKRGVLFWYDLNGRVAASMYLAKAYMMSDALTRGRTNGAVIMVGWDCPAGADFDASQQRAAGFVRALLPLLPQFIPS